MTHMEERRTKRFIGRLLGRRWRRAYDTAAGPHCGPNVAKSAPPSRTATACLIVAYGSPAGRAEPACNTIATMCTDLSKCYGLAAVSWPNRGSDLRSRHHHEMSPPRLKACVGF